MTTQAENSCSCALFGTKRCIPRRSVLYNRRNSGQGFAVIDDGGSTVQADSAGERRFQTRIAAPAFQRFHQCAFSAMVIGTGAVIQNHIKVEAAAQDILTNIARGICLFDSTLDLYPRQGQFTAYVNESRRNAASITGNDHSLDQLMRVLLHYHTVFEGTRLAFIGIAAQVARLVVLGKKAPLHTCRKTRSAAPAQSRFLYHLDQIVW